MRLPGGHERGEHGEEEEGPEEGEGAPEVHGGGGEDPLIPTRSTDPDPIRRSEDRRRC